MPVLSAAAAVALLQEAGPELVSYVSVGGGSYVPAAEAPAPPPGYALPVGECAGYGVPAHGVIALPAGQLCGECEQWASAVAAGLAVPPVS